MADPASDTKPGSKWLWIIILILLFILVIAWFVNPLGDTANVQPPPPAAPSTEWAPAAEGPAVDVRLPEVELKTVPAKAASETPAPAGKAD